MRRLNKSIAKIRPEKPSDSEFLRRLYATTRPDLAEIGLSFEQQQQLIDLQFTAQTRHYRAQYNDAEYLIIEQNARPIGRLIIARERTEARLIDIAILPEFRQLGIGSDLLREIQAEAQVTGVAIALHVAKIGRAATFYRRLGFKIVAEQGAHFYMKWVADSPMSIT